jgi:hypothetical protein
MNLKKLFAKYMKEKEPDEAHAKLSASGSERWLGCPGSIRLSEGIPSVENPAGIRGTHTHTLLQFILENMKWKELLETREGTNFKLFISYDAAMLANALFAAQFVWKEKAWMELISGREVELYTEKKVELEGVGFGTSDIILFQPYGLLHVMDYKNGVKVVESVGNTQGLYYLHAAADELHWEFSRLKITIIQPNAPHKSGHIRTWDVSEEELTRAGVLLRKGAKATRKPNAPLVKNDSWCWFCPARPKCPLQLEVKNAKLMDRFNGNDEVLRRLCGT